MQSWEPILLGWYAAAPAACDIQLCMTSSCAARCSRRALDNKHMQRQQAGLFSSYVTKRYLEAQDIVVALPGGVLYI